jgi:hypothetical protein
MVDVIGERFEESAARSRRRAFKKASRCYPRWSNLSLVKDALIAMALLFGIRAVLSIGSSGLGVALR